MRRRPLALAFIAGGLLSAILIPINGYLAAVAWPDWFSEFARGHGSLARFASDAALFVLPVGLIAFGFGAVLFRRLRGDALTGWLACTAGWLIPGLALDVLLLAAVAGDPLAVLGRLAGEFWFWYRLAVVPAALGLAAWLANRPGASEQPGPLAPG